MKTTHCICFIFPAGKYHEQIHITMDSINHDYEQVFGPFIDDNLTFVYVEDPYIRSHHQVRLLYVTQWVNFYSLIIGYKTTMTIIINWKHKS